MKWFRSTTAALVIGLMIGAGSLALAGYNQANREDGNTDFEDIEANRTGGNPSIRLGRQYITITFTDVSRAITKYFASPISGVLFSAFAVQRSSPVVGTTTSLTFGIMVPLSATTNAFVHPTTGGFIALSPTQARGKVYYNRPITFGGPNRFSGIDVTQMLGNTAVRQGGLISIATGGEGVDSDGAGDGDFDIIVIIDPR